MYAAYNVAYGGVEPLRVWEGDISLSHILSALGCIGEANSHPLGAGFVYRIQSILTKAGKNSLWKSKSMYEQNERSLQYLSKPQVFAISRSLGSGQVQKLTFYGPVVGVCNRSWIDSARTCQTGLLSI
jgi:hypothetical protein